MLLSSLILTLFLVVVETRSNVKICTFGGSLMECELMSGQDNFNVTADVNKDMLWQVKHLILKVGAPGMPYQPTVDSKAIVYPDWSLMPNVRKIEIGFYLKSGTDEFALNLDEFQYLPSDSFKGVRELDSFNLSSNSIEVIFAVGLLSDSHRLDLLWVEGCTISAGESWGNIQNVSDLKLIGKQAGNLDLGRLPLHTLTSLYLGLSRIDGVNGTIAQKMTKMKYLSIAVAQGKPLDWKFIKTLATQLQTMELDGYNLGNTSRYSFPTSSTIRYLTLSHSADTELIGEYTFIGDFESIELSDMPSLIQIQDNAMDQNLYNLTVTNMKILSAMPTSLGEYVRPKWVQLTGNPMLLEVPVTMFQDGGYMNDRIEEVDVLGTKLDITCPCDASYLAAMSVVGHVKIHANCLETWVQEGKWGKCQQGDNCWSFTEVCNETCVTMSSNPLKYSCMCRSNEMLLPDKFSCVSFVGCKVEFENSWRCPDYNATCSNEEGRYICRCDQSNMWDSTKMACVINNVIPIVSPTSIIPNTTKTAMTLVPANTTAKTAMTLVPANTTATAMTLVPANTTATAMTLVPANTTATLTATRQTLKPVTHIVSKVSLKPAITSPRTNHTTHKNITAVTLNPIITNTTHGSIKTKSTQTPTPQPNTSPQLPTWEMALIVAGSVIVVAIFSIILVVIIYLGYRKKKSVQVFPRQVSPNLLDDNDLN